MTGGLLAGICLGDAVRDAQTGRLIPRANPGSTPWWCRPRHEPVRLVRFAYVAAILAVTFICPILLAGVVLGLEADDRARMVSNFVRQSEFAGPANLTFVILMTVSFLRLWYVYVLLAIGAVACWRLRRKLAGSLLDERCLRRIAVVHCLALLLVCGHAIHEVFNGFNIIATGPITPAFILSQQSQVLNVIFAQTVLPVAVILLTTVFLGRHLPGYLRHHAWLPMLGVIAAVATGLVVFNTLYAFSFY